tara:strand:+ start:683 stop:871 length:189 start_codon:yes stop_codon:yes gene_type:complete
MEEITTIGGLSDPFLMSLKKVVGYLHKDEMKHFTENPSKDHILYDVLVLKSYLETWERKLNG